MSLALSMLRDRDRVNIVEPGRLHPAVSFARASTATYMGPAGTLLTAAVNAPRYEYDSAGNYLGLLIEEARTNLLTYSQDFTNASWIKVSGGTGSLPVVTPNYATAPDGSANGTRIQFAINGGTTTADLCTISHIASTSAGVSSARTIWLKSNTSSSYVLQFRDDGGAGPQALITITPTWQRFTLLGSTTSTASVVKLFCRGAQGTSDSADVIAFGAQLESGNFATSYIPTVASAVTRSADVTQITDLTKIGFNAPASAIMAEFDSAGYGGGGASLVWGGAAPGSNFSFMGQAVGGALRGTYLQKNGGGAFYNTISGVPQPIIMGKLAASYADMDSAASYKGGAAVARVDAPLPVPPTVVSIGYLWSNGQQVLNGHIKRLTYYPRRLPNIELQRLTA